MKPFLKILKVIIFILVSLPVLVITAIAYVVSMLGAPLGIVFLSSGKGKENISKEVSVAGRTF